MKVGDNKFMAINSKSSNKSSTFSENTWHYNSKYVKPVSANWNKYITNTKTLASNEQISPKNRIVAGITDSINKKLHYHMNDSVWVGSYAANSAKYFDRLYSIWPDYELTSTCTYVFFVRPDLNIIDKSNNKLVVNAQNRKGYMPNGSPSRDQFFRRMNKVYPYLLGNLSGERITGHDFMPVLTGRVESINLPDYKVKDYKLTQPFSGYNMPYASHALESMTGGEFEVTFREDSELSIIYLFHTWLYYINGVTRNLFSPKTVYIRNNKTDYCTSVYVITCKADASEIIHWVKYTGAFPTSVPHSNFSFNLRGGVNNKITIPFAYFHQEPLNPLSIIDFNKNAHITKDASTIPYIPVYSKTTVGGIGLKNKRLTTINLPKGMSHAFFGSVSAMNGTGSGLVKSPFICKEGKKYYLRWKEAKLSPN